LSAQENTFTAHKKENDVKLDWVEKTTVPVKYYIVERSADDKTFTSIEKVENTNNAGEIQHFETLDKSPLKANNYYRLRTIFVNGTESLTESELVVMPSALNLVIFPNPSTEKAFVDLTEWQDKTNIQIEIFDQKGVVVGNQSVANTHDEFVEINLTDLYNGAYTVLISAKNTRPISQQLIVEKLD
jgi:Secretion system C-terminal sorting domain